MYCFNIVAFLLRLQINQHKIASHAKGRLLRSNWKSTKPVCGCRAASWCCHLLFPPLKTKLVMHSLKLKSRRAVWWVVEKKFGSLGIQVTTTNPCSLFSHLSRCSRSPSCSYLTHVYGGCALDGGTARCRGCKGISATRAADFRIGEEMFVGCP